METITCKTKEDAIILLQNAKEFFQSHVDMDNDPSVIAFHLSLIDEIQNIL